MITGLDHIQISIPEGRVADAIAFYVDVLGFTRVPKPAELSQTGAWLTQSGVNIHLGEQSDFATDGHAHPAFCVSDLNSLLAKIETAKCRIRHDNGPTGYARASAWDPFGNRLEFMQRLV
jgi:catechol 2,3-dioxygenase-like lactoylglutathione lyase family enzyme